MFKEKTSSKPNSIPFVIIPQPHAYSNSEKIEEHLKFKNVLTNNVSVKRPFNVFV